MTLNPCTPFLPRSESDSENEIGLKEATHPPASAHVHLVDKHKSRSEDEDRFAVVSRKQRVLPIFIDESLNTPELLKKLNEKTGSKVLGRIVNGKRSFSRNT
ncbi:hypothetical protein NPIL_393751 [Nephila pilipes]|uniref:Uncharacterized protein n=1 Tax=Nephila pilipes TaxID=299642 RepID=A0A8X6QPV1_NEPPI|nr:hypothetical protein NPIL_393751 [Nephila pilipes]